MANVEVYVFAVKNDKISQEDPCFSRLVGITTEPNSSLMGTRARLCSRCEAKPEYHYTDQLPGQIRFFGGRKVYVCQPEKPIFRNCCFLSIDKVTFQRGFPE